jgi:DNA-binding winged helix-turn-helix (wHTH) protein/TolB-like protein/Tfp pilus assembly protein PilF
MKALANHKDKRVYEFDSFVLDETEKALLRDGERVPLTPKALELLIVLVSNAGLVLEKEDLMETVWPETFVEEANLAVNISMLRKALGEMPGGGQYIGTLPRRGYRFAGLVRASLGGRRELEEDRVAANLSSELAIEQQPVARPGSHFESSEPQIERSRTRSFASRLIAHKSRALALTSIIAIVAAAGAYLIFSGRADHRGQGQMKRLAVLPFRNQRPSEETDYLGFALADSVINNLDYLKSLIIRPSSYVEKYVGQKKDPTEIAKELDVDTLLMGSYLKDGEDLIVNAELADVSTGDKLWSESIKGKAGKLAELQNYVARQVVRGLRLNLTDAEGKRLGRNASVDPVAYEYFLRSRYLLSTNNHQKAIELLEKSVELDQNNALAWAYLARAYHINALQFTGDRADLSKAEADYEQALALDPDLSQARLMMAKLLTETGRVEQAAPLLIELLKNNPNMAEAHWELSYAYRYAGLLNESIEQGERALQINTRLESHQFNSYLYTGQYERFLASLPVREDAYVVFYRGMCHYYLGDMNQAAAAFDRAYELNQGSVITQIGKALRLAIAGKNREGLQVLNTAETKFVKPGTGDGEITYKFAQAYDALGDKGSALRALDRSIEQGFFCYSYMAADPLLKTIRGETECARILEKARHRQEAFSHKLEAYK